MRGLLLVFVLVCVARGSRLPYVDVPEGGAVEGLLSVTPAVFGAGRVESPASRLSSYDVADLEASAAWVGGDAEVALLRNLQQDGPWPAVRWLLRVLMLKAFGLDVRDGVQYAHNSELLGYRSAVATVETVVEARPQRDGSPPTAASFGEALAAAEGELYVNRIVGFADQLLDARNDTVATWQAQGCGLLRVGFPPPLYVTANWLNAAAGGRIAAAHRQHEAVFPQILSLDGAKRLSAATLAALVGGAPHCHIPVLLLMLDEEVVSLIGGGHPPALRQDAATAATLALQTPRPPLPAMSRVRSPEFGDLPPATFSGRRVVVIVANAGGVRLGIEPALAGATSTLIVNSRHGDSALDAPHVMERSAPVAGVHYVAANTNGAHFDARYAAALNCSPVACASSSADVVAFPQDSLFDPYHRQRDRVFHFALFLAAEAVLVRVQPPQWPGLRRLLRSVGLEAESRVVGCPCGATTQWLLPSGVAVPVCGTVTTSSPPCDAPVTVLVPVWGRRTGCLPPHARWACYPTHDNLARTAAEVRQLTHTWAHSL